MIDRRKLIEHLRHLADGEELRGKAGVENVWARPSISCAGISQRRV